MRTLLVLLALPALLLAAAPAQADPTLTVARGECAGVSANSVTITLSNCIKWASAGCADAEGCVEHYAPRCNGIAEVC